MKTKFFLLMGVTALVCLTGCKREPKASVNPTYDPDANTVNTQFVLNISTASGNPDTKQTATDVQVSATDFRGITDAHVLTYKLDYAGVNGAHYLYKVGDESSKAEKDYDLKDLAKVSDLILSGKDENHSRIIELSLPLGTNTILLYGRAPTTGTADQQGSVDYKGIALNSSLDNVSFKLNPRLTNKTAYNQYGQMMGGILTYIMNAGKYNQTNANGNQKEEDNSYKFWWPVDATSKGFSLTDAADAHAGYTLYSGSKKWKEYGDAYAANTPQKPLEDVLGEAYYEVMTLQGEGDKTELRAAASVTVVRMVNDMYNIISRVIAATPTTPEEYVAMLVAGDALERAAVFFDFDETSQKMNYRALATIMDGIDACVLDLASDDLAEIDETYFYYSKTSTNDERTEYPGFPKNLNLPVGAAIMTFQKVNSGTANEYVKVVFPSDIPAYGMGGGSFKVEDYRFPAEITYYVNSSIRTSDTAVEKKDYPKVPANWVNSTYWDGGVWKYSEVLSTTRSVAVDKTINYGTALLKSQFAYSAGTIQDNNGGVHTGEKNNNIVVSAGEKFAVTGIIIGGISDEVGWDFIPKSSSTFTKMVYDNLDGKSVTIPAYSGDSTTPTYSAPVYTCTWDNYNAKLAANAQSKVFIGLELVNNTGSDIWGELNMIRDGGTFYLVGELNPAGANADLTNLKKGENVDLSRSDCYYPPFDENGATINAPRVFMQDYITTVKFLFTPTSLQHAYVTMPDLRAGQVSLGLSVDLTWEPGMEFTVNLGDTTPVTTE